MSEKRLSNVAGGLKPALLEEILDRIAEAVFVIDKKGNFLYANRAAYKGRGYSKAEFLKLNVKDINLPERAVFVRERIREVQKAGEAIFETIHVRKDGSTFPVEITSKIINIAGVDGMIAVARDITHRLAEAEKLKASEAKLHEQYAMLRGIINSSDAPIFSVDNKGRFTAFNQAYADAMKLSYGAEIEIGKRIFDYMTVKGDKEKALATFNRVLKGERYTEETQYGEDKKARLYFALAYNPMFDDAGNVVGVSVYARNITEKRLAEANARLESTLRAIPDLMFEVDPEGRIYDYHAPANELLYVPPEEFLGKKVANLLPAEAADVCMKAITVAAKKGWHRGAIYALDLPSGKRWFELSIDAKGRTGNHVDRLLVISRDVTDRILSEQVIQRERDTAKQYLDVVQVIMLAINRNGEVTMINNYGANLLGYREEEIIGKNWFENFLPYHDRAVTLNVFKQIADGKLKGNETVESGILTKSGKELWIRWNNTYVNDNQGNFQFTLSSGEDISNVLETRAELSVSYTRLQEIVEGVIAALSTTVETRDPYTAGHQRRVAKLAVAIAEQLGWGSQQIRGLDMASSIHDIGKMYVPAEVLNKPGKLAPVEFELIKLHSTAGYEIIKDIKFSEPVADMVRQHHERLNGSGYPDGLDKDKILPGAKIMAIADVVEAMSSDRPYRPGHGIDNALKEIQDRKGELYDEEAADACVYLFKRKGFSFN